MKIRGHGRYDYSPLRGRPDYSWPDGRRLAVYFALNLEHFSFGEGLGAELAPGGPQPDVLNYDALDRAALRIVQLASPFAPFSKQIREHTDVLTIERTWTFGPTDPVETR